MKEQIAFQKGRSTIEYYFAPIDEIHEANNAKISVHAVFIDLSETFNTINHSILLNGLTSLGFSMGP